MDTAYHYDPERIEALCGAYRGAGPLSRPFYTSPEVFNADMERVWRRHWLYAGHSCLIPQPGDWMTWAIGHDSVILARGKDGELRAFHNTCRHRGSRICREEQGHARAFVCPYHAWTYDLDGRLKTATEREFGVHQEKLGLHPVPLKNIAGLLFVALGDDPVSFDRVAAEVGEKMKHQGLEDAKLAKSVRYTVKANWKLDLREQSRVLSLQHRASRICAGHLRHRTLLAADDAGRGARRKTRGRALRPHGARRRDGVIRDDRRVLACGAHAVDGGLETQSLDGKPVAPLMGTFRARNEWSDGNAALDDLPELLAARERRPRGGDAHHADRCNDIVRSMSIGSCTRMRSRGKTTTSRR